MSGSLDAIGYGEPVPTWVRTRVGIPLMRVEFGASDSPLDEPGGYRYELSQEDRRLIDQVIKDNQSSDELRKKAALEAWSESLWKVAPALGPQLMYGGYAGSLILDFLGKRVLQPFDLNPASGAISYSNGDWAMVITQVTCGVRDVSGSAQVSIKAAATLLNWRCLPPQFYASLQKWLTRYTSAYIALEGKKPNGSYIYSGAQDIIGPDWYKEGQFYDCPHPGYDGLDWSGANPPQRSNWKRAASLNALVTGVSDQGVQGCIAAGGLTKVCTPFVAPGGAWNQDMAGLADLGMPTDLGALSDPGDFALDKAQLEDLIGKLKETPWYDKYPPADEQVEAPLPKTPHPRDPDWPCAPAIPREPVGRVVRGPGGIRVPRGPGFDPPGAPGDPICTVIGGKRVCGKIRRMPPPGGEIIGEMPPYRDESFTKPFCPKKGTLLVDIVKTLAEDLGLKPDAGGSWIIDDACKKRWPGGCFAKGASKFDAMWKVADMCGYGVIPDPTNPEIGPIKPLPPNPRTFGPYHEHRDLFVFEAVADDLDIPSHVEVSRPHYPGSRGYSVVIEVKTPYALKDKWLTITVPRGTPEADAMDLAAKKARDFEVLTKLTDYAIPYNEFVAVRHQQKLRIPSEGYDATFMVFTFEHDIDLSEGAVTKVRGVELSRTRYAPRFEPYDQVWAGSGVMR